MYSFKKSFPLILILYLHALFESTCSNNPWETKFDKILAINPFICKIRNDALGEEKYIHVFYPVINEKNILQNFEKKYDLYFTGNVGQTASVFSKLFFPLLMGVSNHVVVGGGQGEESKFNFNLKSVDFYEKFMINASSKVSLTYDIQSNPYNATPHHITQRQ